MKTLISAALCAVLLPCFAMTAAAEGECRVRCVVAQSGSVLPDEIHVHDAGGTATAGKLRVKSFLNHEFDLLAPKGGAVVLTTKAEPGSVKTPGDVVGECELPAKAASLILLLSPEATGKLHCKVTVIDSSVKEFPSGSFKIVNLTALPVTVQLEKEKFEFKPGEMRAIKNPPMGDDGSSSMKAFCTRDGKQEQVAAASWPGPGQKRVLQVFSEDLVTKQVGIIGIRDIAKP
ncbi:hypothetical protein [Luteolibacter sp. Populi]|uniref:hypothetical protein n=1 Tax=Luteolibacter sp. Populi TaxID=3230487 RepID=UPI003467C1F5